MVIAHLMALLNNDMAIYGKYLLYWEDIFTYWAIYGKNIGQYICHIYGGRSANIKINISPRKMLYLAYGK